MFRTFIAHFFLKDFGDFVIKYATDYQVPARNTMQINFMQKSKGLLNSFSSKHILQIFIIKGGNICKRS